MKKLALIIVLIILIISGWYASSYFAKNSPSSLTSPSNIKEAETTPVPEENKIEQPVTSPENKNLDAINSADLEKEMKTIDEELNNF